MASEGSVSEAHQLPECTECGFELEGNVTIEWEIIKDPHERAQGRTEAPIFLCSACGAIADYPHSVLRELFASLWNGDPYDV